MDIKTFVKSSINQVISAIKEAEETTNHEVRLIKNKDNASIEFDIATTVEISNNGHAEIKVSILGGKYNRDAKTSEASRVKFGIYVSSENKDIIKQKRNANNNFNNY